MCYPADEHYHTPLNAPESSKQVVVGQRRLINLYAFNKGAATAVLVVSDFKGTGSPRRSTLYPIAAGGFINIAAPAGDRFEDGIFLETYTDAAMGSTAPADFFFKVDYSAYL